MIMGEVKRVRTDAAIGTRYLKKKDLCNYLQIANNTLIAGLLRAYHRSQLVVAFALIAHLLMIG